MTLSDSTLSTLADRVFTFMIADHGEQAGKVIRHAADCHAGDWGMAIHHWDWNPGVGLIAMSAYFESSHEGQVQAYLLEWMRNNAHKRNDIQAVNATAPFGILPDLYWRTEDPAYKEMALSWGDWVLDNAHRTQAGALQHTVNSVESYDKLKDQVWADTIFMAVLFLAKLTRLSGDAAYVREALRQLELHLEVLQDAETGVLFHGYDCATGDHLSGARWTRGNAWLAVGTPMIVEEARKVGVPASAAVLNRYDTLVRNIVKYQATNGLWHTVMDRPSFYQETSGSAGIACGIAKAVKLGLVEASYMRYAELGLQGVVGQIADTGEVLSVSGGTPIMDTVEDYNELTCYATLYGQGLTLMLLAEFMQERS
ncbi:glycoside hydrolase family 105 protein [Cohnella sp. GCM10012308]|uniref:glycoside hydrolase family 88/105 protein n=1 Tax=Cohnella sp. GCM10012308 TaxID=3317329 RepID=UPI003615C537